ncbi:MAG: GntR family transcriptional regulator [Anaerolineae bacterium]|nr:GntR family transcriptional regulator [Anaerolineae bacterium]NUQ05675.1 GntR family transcriptional regulator [Anaerolineae bacterium]
MLTDRANDSQRLNPLQQKARTLETQVYAVVKEAVLSLKLPPGALLVEDELADQLGTSKTPVRNALVKLEQDGLVVRIPYKGTYVSDVSQQDAEEIFELRGVLEGLAARSAVPFLTDKELAQAEAILVEADAVLAQGNLSKASMLGEDFHKLVYKHATNQRLLLFLKMLDDQLRRLRLLSNSGLDRLKKSAGEHRRILEALRLRDESAVEAAFREHHLSVLKDLVLNVEGIASEDGKTP